VRQDRAIAPIEAEENPLKGSLAPCASPVLRIQCRTDLDDLFEVSADFLLLGPDEIQASVNARGQPFQLRLGESPLFTARLRSSDVRTSPRAECQKEFMRHSA
jgi:hypothetical protein